MIPKRRTPMRGEDNPRHKLTASQVREIRRARDTGKSTVELARRFNVTSTTICQVTSNRTWTDAGGPVGPERPGKARGEANGRHVLTVDAVVEMRHAYAKGGVTIAELSRLYRVSAFTICQILAGRTWTDAGGPLRGEEEVKPHDKLSINDVAEIRRLLHAGLKTQAELAIQYNVSRGTICRAYHGQSWSDVDGSNGSPRPGPARGEDNGVALLTESTVLEINCRAKAGESQASIARQLDLKSSTVGAVIRGENWSWLERERGTAPVKLAGENRPVFVFVKGKGWVSKGRLSVERYAIYKALASIYPGGLSGPAMRRECGFGGWRKSLKMMAKDGDHAAVLHLPDATRGDTYRFVWPVD